MLREVPGARVRGVWAAAGRRVRNRVAVTAAAYLDNGIGDKLATVRRVWGNKQGGGEIKKGIGSDKGRNGGEEAIR